MSAGLLAVALITSATLEFEWSAPATCPTAEVVRARLGEVTGKASATVTERAAGWVLQVRANESVRELTSRTCEDAADAAVLIIQLALKSSREAPAPTVEPQPPPGDPPLPEVVLPPVEPARWRVHVALSGGALVGWLPKVVGRLGVSVALERSSLVLFLTVHTGFPQRYDGGPTPTAALNIHQLVDAQAGGCWAFTAGRLRVGPCLDGGAGLVLIEGLNVSAPKSSVVVVPHGGPGVRATFAVTEWLELLASAWGRASARPSISFQGSSPVVEASWVSAEFLVGAGGVF
ncbi:MAG: hypothetical protein ABTQ32_23915 [Myxococcaceae bacterium]